MAKRTGVGKVFGRAAIGPLNLGVLGGAVLGAVALASWPIAALGGAAYAALVASDVSSAEFRRRILFGRAKPTRLPDPKSIEDSDVRAAVEQIAAARREVDQVIKGIPDRVQRNVATAIAAIDELEGHGALLALRAAELSRYLASVDRMAVHEEADAHAARAKSATDSGAREQYTAAATAARERAAALADIATARERTLAHLVRIASAIKVVPTKLVRLRALDEQASDALTDDVGAELERMNIDLRSFEQTLEAIVEVK
jgi:hypothetical protein